MHLLLCKYKNARQAGKAESLRKDRAKPERPALRPLHVPSSESRKPEAPAGKRSTAGKGLGGRARIASCGRRLKSER